MPLEDEIPMEPIIEINTDLPNTSVVKQTEQEENKQTIINEIKKPVIVEEIPQTDNIP